MPRSFEANKNIRRLRKKTIAEAAMSLFSVYGYENVHAEQITKAAHCSHGLMYRYYMNQKDVFLAAERSVLTRDNGKYLISFKALSNKPNGSGILDIIDFFAMICDAEEDVVRYYATLAHDDFEFNSVPSSFYDKSDKLIFRQMVEEGIKSGIIIDVEPGDIVNLLCDFLTGRLSRRLRLQGKQIPKSLFSFIIKNR